MYRIRIACIAAATGAIAFVGGASTAAAEPQPLPAPAPAPVPGTGLRDIVGEIRGSAATDPGTVLGQRSLAEVGPSAPSSPPGTPVRTADPLAPPPGLGIRGMVDQIRGADVMDAAGILAQRPLAADPSISPQLSLNPFDGDYLLPQHAEPTAPGETTLAGDTPGVAADTRRYRDYLRSLWSLHTSGQFDGAMLGQNPHSTPGEPIPAEVPAPRQIAAPPPH